MAFIEIQKRCDDCEKTRALLRELKSEVESSLLDYENLYHKVRTNLAKLAKQQKASEAGAEASPNGDKSDPLAAYRRQLAERKLSRVKG